MIKEQVRFQYTFKIQWWVGGGYGKGESCIVQNAAPLSTRVCAIQIIMLLLLMMLMMMCKVVG